MTKLHQTVIDLYDQYTHSDMPRRIFLERLTKLCGGAAALSTILPLLEVDYAQAAVVAEDDKRLTTSTVTFGKKDKKYKGYLVLPHGKSLKELPVVLVIHENKGLQPHIRDVARRVALLGYAALAPDALSELGGTPTDPEKAKALIQKLSADDALAVYLAAAAYAKSEGKGKVGAVGFCWGGGMVNQLAVHDPSLNAGVAFYGRQPDTKDVAKIKAPLLLHYAGLDERINAGIKDYEAALKKDKKSYEVFVYPKVQHAFHNDTAGDRYDKKAAELAWGRTVAFFKKHL